MILILLFTVTAVSAAPYSLSSGTLGNTSGFITVTNPASVNAATVENSYIVSGYGKPGVTVTLYKLSGGVYYKTGYSWNIGASGLFFKQIVIGTGKNYYLCYAESGNLYQIARFEVTGLNNFNNIRVNPFQ